jgi:anti-sigma factor RsiW
VTGAEDWISEAELHAHLDGELEAERCVAVQAFLADHPEAATRARSYRRHAALIARVYGPLLDRPLPAPLAAAAMSPAPARRPPRWRWLAASAAAALVLLAGGFGSGWWLHDELRPISAQAQSFVADAIDAHLVYAVEVRHPVEVGANQEAHLVTWLSRRLGLSLTAPDLTAQGFELIGGRLLPASTGAAAAQLMYQDASGRRLTLYCRATSEPGETSFRIMHRGKLTALYWREAGTAWALLGELPQDELLRLGHLAYQALNS